MHVCIINFVHTTYVYTCIYSYYMHTQQHAYMRITSALKRNMDTIVAANFSNSGEIPSETLSDRRYATLQGAVLGVCETIVVGLRVHAC